jgi:uncharacterized protein YdaU (DUF1376 family)
MALRDQPYFPLYVQDYLTDEKLNNCSAATQGIYIKILCVLHKQDEYGTILFKQNSQQNISKIKYFAARLSKQLTFESSEIESALEELIEEKVIIIDDEKLYQKRMVRDNHISEVRSKAGKSGGGNPVLFKQKPKHLYKQISKQKPEYENENENEDVNDNKSENVKINIAREKLKNEFDKFRLAYPGKKRGLDTEFENLVKKHKDYKQVIPELERILKAQYYAKNKNIEAGYWEENWQNLQTYINQRSWEIEITIKQPKTQITNGKQSLANKLAAADRIIAEMHNH